MASNNQLGKMRSSAKVLIIGMGMIPGGFLGMIFLSSIGRFAYFESDLFVVTSEGSIMELIFYFGFLVVFSGIVKFFVEIWQESTIQST